MLNSNEIQALDFEQKEQELRFLAAQRQAQLDNTLNLKERKLKEQDVIIRAQMDKISQLQLQLSDQTKLILQYEERFEQIKDAVQSQSQKHKAELDANIEDLREWQDRVQRLELQLQTMVHERSDLISKVKDSQWVLDQELKRGQKEVAVQIERSQIEKQNYLKEIDQTKKDIQERHFAEIKEKNAELIRSETIYSERISKLEKELSRVQLIQIQSKQSEDDLRQKCEILQAKNERLKLDLFNSGDTERKQSIHLSLQVNELKQDLEMREIFSQKQIQEWQLKIQNLSIERERLSLDLQQSNERLQHQQTMLTEKTELEIQKVRANLERKIESQNDQINELIEEKDQLNSKVHKLNSNLKDNERESRRELTSLLNKLREAESNFEQTSRDHHQKLQLKQKEILSQREEIDELNSKINSKTQELRHQIAQNSIISAKFEEVVQELENMQQQQHRSYQKYDGESNINEIEDLRSENIILKETLQRLQNSENLQFRQKDSSITPRQQSNLVDEDQQILINSGRQLQEQINMGQLLSTNQQYPHSTKHKNQKTLNILPFSPINSDDHHTRNDSAAQTTSLQQTSEIEQLRIRLADCENENRNLRLKQQADWNQLQELQKALFKANNLSRSVDQHRQEYQDTINMKDLTIRKIQTEYNILAEQIQALKNKIFDLERQLIGAKLERDKLIEVSQNLKIQLSNSEKKAASIESNYQKSAKSSIANDQSDFNSTQVQNQQPSNGYLSKYSVDRLMFLDDNHLNKVVSQQKNTQNLVYDDQGGFNSPSIIIDDVNSSFAIQNQNTSKIRNQEINRLGHRENILQRFNEQRISDMSGLENFQPNMKMFDASILSGLTGMSIEQQQILRSKNFSSSPTSILKQSYQKQNTQNLQFNNDDVAHLLQVSPDSGGNTLVKKNITFGESRVHFKDDIESRVSLNLNNQEINDINLFNNFRKETESQNQQIAINTSSGINESAKAAAQARLQQLKNTYQQSGFDKLFPVQFENEKEL